MSARYVKGQVMLTVDTRGYTVSDGFQPIQDICQANLFHRHYRENDLAPDRVTSGLKVLCVSRFAMVC